MITEENIPYTADEIKAMVKTCEKYNKALERAKKLYEQGTITESLGYVFPELQETTDERIRKGLIKAVSGVLRGNTLYGTDVTREEALAWLEKQEEKVTNINGEDYGIDGLYHAINILEKTIGRVGGYQSDDGILSHKAAINAVKELYEKQGDKKPKTWCAEDEQNLNVVLSFIEDESLRRWLKDKLCYDTLDANRMIEWLYENVANFWASPCNPQNIINQFKKDFGL